MISDADMNENSILKDFFLGFIKIHILHHAAEKPFYGREIKEELENHGYTLSFGTLYPVLHKLCKNGFLTRKDINVDGKIRKYYSITGRGKQMLGDAKVKIRELTDEVLV